MRKCVCISVNNIKVNKGRTQNTSHYMARLVLSKMMDNPTRGLFHSHSCGGEGRISRLMYPESVFFFTTMHVFSYIFVYTSAYRHIGPHVPVHAHIYTN